VNNDGATRSCPNLTSCANISWGSWKEYVGSFSVFFYGCWLLFMLSLWGHLCFGTCFEGGFSDALIKEWFFLVCSDFLDQRVVS